MSRQQQAIAAESAAFEKFIEAVINVHRLGHYPATDAIERRAIADLVDMRARWLKARRGADEADAAHPRVNFDITAEQGHIREEQE